MSFIHCIEYCKYRERVIYHGLSFSISVLYLSGSVSGIQLDFVPLEIANKRMKLLSVLLEMMQKTNLIGVYGKRHLHLIG